MLMNLEAPFLNIGFGAKPLTDENQNPIHMKTMLIRALQGHSSNTQSPSEIARCYKLLTQIEDSAEIELTDKDRDLLIQVVTSSQFALLFKGQLLQALGYDG